MAATEERPTIIDAVRAFGVMLGGSALFAGAAAASIGITVRALARGRRPPSEALAGTIAAGAYVAAVRPWLQTWGVTPGEAGKALPGDEVIPEPGGQTTRAVTIDAPVEEVWPWIAQLGQDRAGFYSYEWLENLAGARMKNTSSVQPEWQERELGEIVKLHWANGLELTRFEPNRVFALGGWYLVLEPRDGQTRLYARTRFPAGPASIAYAFLLELPHFIMERKMLLGIKELSERARSRLDQ